jgi:hypothetical protein
VIFHKSNSQVLNSSGKHVCGISRIRNVFKLIFLLISLPLGVCSLSLLPSPGSCIGD